MGHRFLKVSLPMTFPLVPIMPSVQGVAADGVSDAKPIIAQVSFSMMFDLGTMENEPADVALPNTIESAEIIEEQDDPKVTEGEPDKPVITAEIEALPMQVTPEKPQKTFLETAFATIPVDPKVTAEKLPIEQVTQTANRVAQQPEQGQAAGLIEKPQQVLAKMVAGDADQPRQESVRQPDKPKFAAPILQTEPSPAKPLEANIAMRPALPAENGIPRDKRPATNEGGIDAKPAQLPQAATPVQPPSIGQYVIQTISKETHTDPIRMREEAPAPSIHPQTPQVVRTPTEISAPIAPAIAPFMPTTTETELFKPPLEIPLVQGINDVQTGQPRVSATEATQMPPQTPQLAKTVSHQMAVAVSQSVGGSTEIVLSPEELGKVRMVMSAQETGITVLIHTERPETNDLLRRHIETLSQEFKNLGYSTTSFTFAQDQQGQSGQQPEANVQQNSTLEDKSDVMRPVNMGSSAGLDLRI